MAQRGRKAKGKFDDLDPAFKDSIDSGTDSEINAKLSELAKLLEANAIQRKADMDLATAKEKVKELAGPYSDTEKDAKLRISYAYSILEARGKIS